MQLIYKIRFKSPSYPFSLINIFHSSQLKYYAKEWTRFLNYLGYRLLLLLKSRIVEQFRIFLQFHLFMKAYLFAWTAEIRQSKTLLLSSSSCFDRLNATNEKNPTLSKNLWWPSNYQKRKRGYFYLNQVQ